MEKTKKLLVLTGGGDCPGLNAVIRGIAKRARKEKNWEVYGSVEAFNGVFSNPPELIKLTRSRTGGIHVRGGTILRTTNKGNPIHFPVVQPDGTFKFIDRSEELVKRIKELGFDAVINIGGDGSQKISQALFKKGLNVIGVPKTIDNDLSSTDMTFGFQTAVQIATDSFDKLVTTAESHDRVMIMEVMGRDAGWIALHTAIAGGAEICLIPEIPYDVNKIVKRIQSRYVNGKGFVNIVISEGAKAKDGSIVSSQGSKGSEHVRLGGVAYQLSKQLKDAGCEAEIRETVLGHVQRGGGPTAFDRVLATLFGVKAVELLLEGNFGRMVALKNNTIASVTLEEATEKYNFVDKNGYLVKAAKGLGISFGD
ncbi:MAG: ATP-dependent 6-phosphofructokinase [Cytophagales bacterium]|jgi:6-phosphofructokinase 1|nr:ATP-dependent 6-phosphofructokinase [Cytophagales bacterium]MCA6365476.1 ATP-dependent 6-phosphofructokinase [Cytophagales bacterium]MCA6370342.1 ATP-dependent 6-phosphofructokinase [Cytophagales bacterium]MCA6376478.1 ATP-dependent 6-phosphofructokinase [Cytophagales bacterium]MCA6385483.1 ATP-dependent 6-phosphofructokinase [Cytophagales bacterium]